MISKNVLSFIKLIMIIFSVLYRVVEGRNPVQYVVWIVIGPAMNVTSKQDHHLLVLVAATRIALHGALEIGLR